MKYKLNGLEYLRQLIATATPNECVMWDRAKSPYGSYDINTITYLAHRVSLEIKVGRKLQPNEDACHTCDIPACVNPHHLWVGTRQDNLIDAVSKGKKFGSSMRGSTNPSSKLTEEEVKAIKVSSLSQRKLAKQYNVSQPMIGYIKQGKFWSHIQ